MLITETYLLSKNSIVNLMISMFEQIALASAQYIAALFILMMLGIMTLGTLWAKTTASRR
jgi:hypothetical protein